MNGLKSPSGSAGSRITDPYGLSRGAHPGCPGWAFCLGTETARGDEHNFASPDEVIRKFLRLARPTLGAAAVEELCDVLLHVEKLEAAAAIPRLLSRAPR